MSFQIHIGNDSWLDKRIQGQGAYRRTGAGHPAHAGTVDHGRHSSIRFMAARTFRTSRRSRLTASRSRPEKPPWFSRCLPRLATELSLPHKGSTVQTDGSVVEWERPALAYYPGDRFTASKTVSVRAPIRNTAAALYLFPKA